eukprot:5663683-Ditylum_brightwellii.AAC.1
MVRDRSCCSGFYDCPIDAGAPCIQGIRIACRTIGRWGWGYWRNGRICGCIRPNYKGFIVVGMLEVRRET